MTGHHNVCESCKTVFKTVVLLRHHIRTEHGVGPANQSPAQDDGQAVSITCNSCGFKTETKNQLRLHEEARHSNGKSQIECTYWQRSMCTKGMSFSYSHSSRKVCKFQNECRFWPSCKFEHFDSKPCHFQENCLNVNCKFVHFNLGFSSEANQNPFLGSNYNQEFPPLAQVSRPW